jgi:hypothetical protein
VTANLNKKVVDVPKATDNTIIEINEAKTCCGVPHVKDVDVELVVSRRKGAVPQQRVNIVLEKGVRE